MNFDTMSKQRKYVMIAAAVGVIGMFLPWYRIAFFGSIYGGSMNGMHGSGIFVFLCLAACVVIAFLGDQTKTLDKTFWMIVLIASGLASLWMIIQFLESIGYGFSYLSYGFYIAFLATLATLYCAYKYRSPSDNIKDGFDSMKKDIETKMKSDTGSSTPPSSGDQNSSGKVNPPM